MGRVMTTSIGPTEGRRYELMKRSGSMGVLIVGAGLHRYRFSAAPAA